MRKLFLLLFLIIHNITNCQIKTGEVTYKFILGDFDKGDVFKRASKSVEDKIQFVLKFNDSLSVYEMITGIKDDNSIPLAAAFSGYSNPVYYNKKENISYVNNTFTPFADDEEFLITSKDTISWKLINEVKMINNYKCFKATKKRLTTKKANDYFDLIAWYCPEIAVSLGPLDSSGLPGLIFELYNLHGLIAIDKINLNINPLISIPKKGTVVTQEEYRKIINKRIQANSSDEKN